MAYYGIDKDGKVMTAGRISRRDGMIALILQADKTKDLKLGSLDDAVLEGFVRSLGAKGWRLVESNITQAVGRPFRVTP